MAKLVVYHRHIVDVPDDAECREADAIKGFIAPANATLSQVSISHLSHDKDPFWYRTTDPIPAVSQEPTLEIPVFDPEGWQ